MVDQKTCGSTGALASDEPRFEQAWQATAHAMVMLLIERGCFTSNEWMQFLSEELGPASEDHGEATDGRYYEHWQTALEKLVAAKKIVDDVHLSERVQAWQHAYRMTPHGQPVRLDGAQERVATMSVNLASHALDRD